MDRQTPLPYPFDGGYENGYSGSGADGLRAARDAARQMAGGEPSPPGGCVAARFRLPKVGGGR
ncbi:hypothetical protein [Actinomadura macrotermitis]|uniref:Spondin domain-containing protein n=1 Tax=Actinomadura macrotermitis TaxID=2585200 RepID=A0A7K0BWP7_9ACTN|nr:hypothetical protein [Actinomadura macrotermitis]MQY05588.1 hypothetical protein [Actinomadura macrotermitis]